MVDRNKITIKDFKKDKEFLEIKIRQLIKEFQTKNMCHVDRVDLEVREIHTVDGHTIHVVDNVKLEAKF